MLRRPCGRRWPTSTARWRRVCWRIGSPCREVFRPNMTTDIAVRVGPRLNADPRRVITRLFVPGAETVEGHSRARAVISRVLALDERSVEAAVRDVAVSFDGRHRDLPGTLA